MTQPRLVWTRTNCRPSEWPPENSRIRPGVSADLTFVEDDAAAEIQPHHAEHILDLEGMIEGVVLHVGPVA